MFLDHLYEFVYATLMEFFADDDIEKYKLIELYLYHKKNHPQAKKQDIVPSFMSVDHLKRILKILTTYYTPDFIAVNNLLYIYEFYKHQNPKEKMQQIIDTFIIPQYIEK